MGVHYDDIHRCPIVIPVDGVERRCELIFAHHRRLGPEHELHRAVWTQDGTLHTHLWRKVI